MPKTVSQVTRMTSATAATEKQAKPRPDLVPLSLVAHVWGPLPYYSQAMRARGNPAALTKLGLKLMEQCSSLSAAIAGVGEVLGYGVHKYGACTWRDPKDSQADPDSHFQSLIRHVFEWEADNRCNTDPETGLPHLHHAIAQLGILLELLDSAPQKENNLATWFGTWLGNETDEELLQALKDIK